MLSLAATFAGLAAAAASASAFMVIPDAPAYDASVGSVGSGDSVNIPLVLEAAADNRILLNGFEIYPLSSKDWDGKPLTVFNSTAECPGGIDSLAAYGHEFGFRAIKTFNHNLPQVHIKIYSVDGQFFAPESHRFDGPDMMVLLFPADDSVSGSGESEVGAFACNHHGCRSVGQGTTVELAATVTSARGGNSNALPEPECASLLCKWAQKTKAFFSKMRAGCHRGGSDTSASAGAHFGGHNRVSGIRVGGHHGSGHGGHHGGHRGGWGGRYRHHRHHPSGVVGILAAAFRIAMLMILGFVAMVVTTSFFFLGLCTLGACFGVHFWRYSRIVHIEEGQMDDDEEEGDQQKRGLLWARQKDDAEESYGEAPPVYEEAPAYEEGVAGEGEGNKA